VSHHGDMEEMKRPTCCGWLRSQDPVLKAGLEPRTLPAVGSGHFGQKASVVKPDLNVSNPGEGKLDVKTSFSRSIKIERSGKSLRATVPSTSEPSRNCRAEPTRLPRQPHLTLFRLKGEG